MIIVTGGTGLVGSHLLLMLAEKDAHVRALIRPGRRPETLLKLWQHYTSAADDLYRKIEWYETDLSNPASIADGIAGWEKLYHCAASVSFNPRRKKEIWQTNILMVRDLVNACLDNNTGKFIHVSSVAAVAKPQGDGPGNEKSGFPVKPGSVYAKTKTLGELEVWRGINEGLNAVIVNPSIILGPSVKIMGSSMLFETLRKGISFYPAGSSGFVDVRDVAEVMVRLADSNISGERFILNGANISYRELFEKILACYGQKPPKYKLSGFTTSLAAIAEWFLTLFTGNEPRITLNTARSSHGVQAYSAEKVSKVAGFRFREIDDTLRETCGYYGVRFRRR